MNEKTYLNNTFKAITLRDLLKNISPKSRASLEAIAADPQISYLIVFESADRKRRRILPAGADQDFRSPQDAVGQTYDGLRASAFVNLGKEREKNEAAEAKARIEATESTTTSKPADENAKLKSKVTRQESEIRRLEDRLVLARKRVNEKDLLIEELKTQLSNKRYQQNEAAAPEGLDEAPDGDEKRFSDVAKAEEDLIARMNDYMVKEAELEQREQDLNYRESKLFRNAG